MARLAQRRGTNPAHAGMQLLTLGEVAAVLAVDAETVEELVARRELRAVRVAGLVRVSLAALQRLLAEAEVHQ